ncbi:suppressor of fused domain protein [Streptomyces smyrnaeus]|uniref:suppressor of fused domain protein n=1 Tax=Streptomyces smyrnaeus TaxID=1387713 RepID=UPI0033EBACDF
MSAPPILRDVFHALRDEWGDEHDGVTFEHGPPPVERLDVMLFRAADPGGVTAFATVGMSAHPMPPREGRAGGRAELRLFRRGILQRGDEQGLATRLANLAVYPWTQDRPLGWGELVGFGDELPAFPGCSSVLLAGAWAAGQTSTVETSVEPVRILNVVPVSEPERQHALTRRPEDFFSDLLNTRDIFAPPPRG